MKRIFCILCLTAFLFQQAFSYLAELVVHVRNNPDHTAVTFVFTNVGGRVWDANFQPTTTRYQTGSATTSLDLTGFDFLDNDAGTSTIAYGLYKITTTDGPSHFYTDWRDCNVTVVPVDVEVWYNVTWHRFEWQDGSPIDTGSTINQWDYVGRSHTDSCFSPLITFTNKIGSASAGGTLTVAGVSQVSSGGSLNLTENQSFTVRTDQQFFSNWNNGGVTYEHNNWNGTLSELRLPHGFTSNYGPNQTQDAMFLDIRPVSFATQLLDGGSGGIVKLNDPWWVDQYGNQPGNVFNTATSANVFLNQNTLFDTSKPMYKVLAPSQSITLGSQTYDWNFINWTPSGANLQNGSIAQTPVVFSSSGATITANLKAHLASSTSAVTTAFGQRRLVNWSGGTTMIYPSANEIWSAVNTGGSTWAAEAKASSEPGTKSNPALCNTRATWLTYTPSSQYVINYSTWNGNSWSSPVTVATVSDGSTRPVIGFSNARYVSYFDDYVGASMPIVAYKSDASTITVKRSTDGTTWYYDVLTHSSAVDNVSLSPYTSETIPNTVVMAYEQNNAIQYRTSMGGIWGAQDVVPTSTGVAFRTGTLTANSASLPQVVRSGASGLTHTDFVWHQTQTYLQYGTLDYIVQQSWDDYGWYWWDAVAYQVYTPSSPTIAPLSSDRLLLMWDESGTLKKLSGGYGTWGSVTTVGPGKNPVVAVPGGTLSSSALYMATKNDGGPLYRIVTPGGGLSKSTATESEGRIYVRSIAAVDTITGAVFNVVMSQPHIGQKTLPFVAANDSVRKRTKESFLHLLETEPLDLTDAEDTVSFDLAVSSKGWDATSKDVAFNVNLVDDKDATPLLSLGSVHHRLTDQGEQAEVRTSVKQLKGKRAAVKLSNRLMENIGEHCIYTVTHVYLLDPAQQNLEKGNKDRSNQALPSEVALVQNYPNPFNPTTVVRYQLPVDSKVSLRVFDILGREVVTLVDGQMEAGYHTATFDASKLASGLYFARLNVVSSSGKSFIETIKMLLTK